MLQLLQLWDKLGPADIGHAEIIVLQPGEANIHQDLTQTVVQRVQDETLCKRAVGGPHLQLPGASRGGASR